MAARRAAAPGPMARVAREALRRARGRLLVAMAPVARAQWLAQVRQVVPEVPGQAVTPGVQAVVPTAAGRAAPAAVERAAAP